MTAELLGTTAAPWWLVDAADGSTPQPALRGRREADVVVIGGGYTGMWTARAIRRRDPGRHVVLLEQDRCGEGPSGRNGGFVHGYWGQIGQLRELFGDRGALEVARAADRAQQELLAFCWAADRDVWLRTAGIAMVAATPSQDASVDGVLTAARELGIEEEIVSLDREAARALCDSPRFRHGVLYPGGATVQPARLAAALRAALLADGVEIHEHSAVAGIEDRGDHVEVRTAEGVVHAGQAIVATNAALSASTAFRRRLTNFSSLMVLTEPVPDLLEQLGWTSGVGLFDGRMFVHYLRTTPDGRVAIGSGSGPIAFRGRLGAGLYRDAGAIARAQRGLGFLLPALQNVRVEHAWGGPLDISADGLPFFRTAAGGRLLYAAGFSGHGVNPTYLAGEVLASLALGQEDEWTSLPLVGRDPGSFPPEPLRWIGGQFIRRSILRVEDGAEGYGRVTPVARIGAALPRIFRLKVGTR